MIFFDIEEYPGYDSKDYLILVDTEEQREHWPNLNDKVITVPEISKKSEEIKHLSIYGYYYFEFPLNINILERIKSLSNLQFLGLPIPLGNCVRSNQIPSSVRVLSIIGDGTVKFIKNEMFLNIQWLRSFYAKLRFEKKAFPRLKNLACKLGTSKMEIQNIASYQELDSLQIGPVKDSSMFEQLQGNSIYYLNIWSGSIKTLEGIERIRDLRILKLGHLSKLSDVKALEKCKELEALQIIYCTRIADIDSIARIPKLKHLRVVACRDLDMEYARKKFNSLNLDMLELIGYHQQKLWANSFSTIAPMNLQK